MEDDGETAMRAQIRQRIRVAQALIILMETMLIAYAISFWLKQVIT